ncbi:MAG TPA: CHASE sensor domain-containing protein, partial [Candidatus Limnocylindrales bacterium]|nr:CHASE sensor domain-containing protein [Candidatus Limnocylindrales bacterium]
MNSAVPEPQSSIQKRVRAVILIASVTVVFVTAAAFVTYEAIDFRSRSLRNLSTLTAVIADNSGAPLAFSNKAVAEEILGALRVEPDIEAAILIDDQGNIFATYPKTLPAALLPRNIEPKGYRFEDAGLVIFEPVRQENKSIGTLYLRASFFSRYQQF